ncbi:unnamed protein product [Peniophora sp. CBMAI 1063]|nr:unnamed protein product [Peniophora sp. CBMAI 1063]
MFARAVIIAAAVALATAHAQPEGSDYAPYDPYQQDNSYDVEYKKPEYGYKESAYDKAYDYAFEHYAHEAKEDKRNNYEAPAYEPEYQPEYTAPESDYQPEYEPEYKPEYEPEYKPEYEEKPAYQAEAKPCDDYSCYSDSEYVPAPVSDCNKGDLQCCNQVQPANTVDFEQFADSEVYELIPNILRGSNAPVGLACSPIINDLSGGAQCNQQTVCCDGGHFSGLFSVNCNAFNGGSQSAGIF